MICRFHGHVTKLSVQDSDCLGAFLLGNFLKCKLEYFITLCHRKKDFRLFRIKYETLLLSALYLNGFHLFILISSIQHSDDITRNLLFRNVQLQERPSCTPAQRCLDRDRRDYHSCFVFNVLDINEYHE